uniref:Uncharacterized protein n=1 Tax=Anguilla anguilla TaxID=7936 RepID=A0A0E9SFC2_ANGAN
MMRQRLDETCSQLGTISSASFRFPLWGPSEH